MNRAEYDFDKIMNEKGIRPTAVRQMIFKVLATALHPLSGLDIETELDTVDRSTITRTLALFSETDLVHTIDDGSGSMKYELCASGTSHSPADMHPHFHCRSCGVTVCLDNYHIPDVELPEGYITESLNFTVIGLCPRCS